MSISVNDLGTPALVVDVEAFEHNVTTMSQLRPGLSLRPHVKAFKSTDLAGRLAEVGHTAFCCATVSEMAGMAKAGWPRTCCSPTRHSTCPGCSC